MHTVYGIYKKGEVMPVYVGCTSMSLTKRMKGHRNRGVKIYLQPKDGQGSRVRLYGYWMWMHVVGVIQLEIRKIAATVSRSEALRWEELLVIRLRPMLNTAFMFHSPLYQVAA